MNRKTSYIDSQRAFAGGPDWRWRMAHGDNLGLPHDPDAPADEHVEQARAYLAAVERDAGRGQREHPQVAAAVKLWEDPGARKAVALLCLANCPVADVAQRLAVAESTVAWAERLFFDVRSRLSAPDWIAAKVFETLIRQGDVERAVECRAAFWGGSGAAEVILGGDPKLATDGAKRLTALEDRLHRKAQAALELPLTADNSFKFAREALAHQVAMQRLKLAREKFQHACELAAEKQRFARQRRQAEAEAAKRRAAQSPLARLKWAANPATTKTRQASRRTPQKRRHLATTRQDQLDRHRRPSASPSQATAV